MRYVRRARSLKVGGRQRFGRSGSERAGPRRSSRESVRSGQRCVISDASQLCREELAPSDHSHSGSGRRVIECCSIAANCGNVKTSTNCVAAGAAAFRTPRKSAGRADVAEFDAPTSRVDSSGRLMKSIVRSGT